MKTRDEALDYLDSVLWDRTLTKEAHQLLCAIRFHVLWPQLNEIFLARTSFPISTVEFILNETEN